MKSIIFWGTICIFALDLKTPITNQQVGHEENKR